MYFEPGSGAECLIDASSHQRTVAIGIELLDVQQHEVSQAKELFHLFIPDASVTVQTDMDAVINIGDFSVSLYEGEQEILGKLDKMGLLYEKVEDSDNKKYNYYYNVGDGKTQFIQVHFLEKECVRIRISSNETFAQTSRGIYSGNTYSQMVDQYGDSYEKHTYMGKERYTIYRYALGECFHEFGIPGEATGEIYNVDVYVSGQMPIYDYGEEIEEDLKFFENM